MNVEPAWVAVGLTMGAVLVQTGLLIGSLRALRLEVTKIEAKLDTIAQHDPLDRQRIMALEKERVFQRKMLHRFRGDVHRTVGAVEEKMRQTDSEIQLLKRIVMTGKLHVEGELT